MFFTKPTYEEIRLPFRYIEAPDELESGIISIEAFGNICGKDKYCYAVYSLEDYMYHNGDFERMIELLRNSADKTVKVTIKIKKGIPKDFKLDLNSLAETYNDERFKLLTLIGWGFNDKSYEKLSAK